MKVKATKLTQLEPLKVDFPTLCSNDSTMSSLAWLHPEELQELRGESCHHQFRWLLLKRRLFGHLQSALKHRMPIRRHRTITLVATDYREITVLSQYVVTFHDGWGNKYGLPDHVKGLPDPSSRWEMLGRRRCR